MPDRYFILIQSFFASQIRNEMENKYIPSKNIKKIAKSFYLDFKIGRSYYVCVIDRDSSPVTLSTIHQWWLF